MEQYWIIARSVTYAQRMEKALAGAGIRTRIFRAPRELSGGALRPALAILRGAGLDPMRLYQLQNGTYRELSL